MEGFLEVPIEDFFWGPFPVRASLVEGWWEDWETSPSSALLVPLPYCTLFYFFSAASTEKVHVGVGVVGRVTIGTAGGEPISEGG